MLHSEFNPSETDPVHFLQVWIVPERQGMEPSYEQKRFEDDEKRGRLRLIGSRDGREGSITIHQDVNLYAGLFNDGESHSLRVGEGRHVWVQVIRGSLRVNGELLDGGDAAAIRETQAVTIEGVDAAEALVFDLA